MQIILNHVYTWINCHHVNCWLSDSQSPKLLLFPLSGSRSNISKTKNVCLKYTYNFGQIYWSFVWSMIYNMCDTESEINIQWAIWLIAFCREYQIHYQRKALRNPQLLIHRCSDYINIAMHCQRHNEPKWFQIDFSQKGGGAYIIFVIFAPRTRFLGSFLLHTKVRKSLQNGFCAETA